MTQAAFDVFCGIDPIGFAMQLTPIKAYISLFKAANRRGTEDFVVRKVFELDGIHSRLIEVEVGQGDEPCLGNKELPI
jgi:hypothetical protein